MVVGYMGVPYYNTDMTSHPQYVTVRNERGAEMMSSVASSLETYPTASQGDRRPFVTSTVVQDDEGKMGRAPGPMPRWLGNILAKVLLWLGPKGLEFGRYSIDYHYIRNFIFVNRHMGSQRAARHMPEYAKRIVAQYNGDGSITKRVQMDAPEGSAAARIAGGPKKK